MAGLLWLFYLLHEYSVKSGHLCPEGGKIRVDLLLIYPLLILFSMTAAIVALGTYTDRL